MRQTHRLRSRKDIEHILWRGRKIDGPLFRLVAAPNSYGYLRLALIASRSVDKRAVARNRLRRRAREWVRKKSEILQIPADAAIIFKKPASGASQKIFYEELARLFLKFARYSV